MATAIRTLLLMSLTGTLGLGLVGCATPRPLAARQPLRHFFQVDHDLYRGAQPTAEGFRELKVLGVKTVISLRALRPSEQRETEREIEALGMRWISLPMRMYWRATPEQIREFLTVATNPANQPVFIHCEQGEDRTGSMVAIYRIVKDGWAPERAYHEAVALGMADWNPFMKDLIFREAEGYATDREVALAR